MMELGMDIELKMQIVGKKYTQKLDKKDLDMKQKRK